MPSNLFASDSRGEIERRVAEVLSSERGFLSATTARSTRAVGDAIENIVSQRWLEILPDATDLTLASSRRAMADFSFSDRQGIRHLVDVKTHRLETKHNMPNLTSVARLDPLYRDRNKSFDILLVRYGVRATELDLGDVTFTPSNGSLGTA